MSKKPPSENVAKMYSEAEAKVLVVTSNEPWGAPTNIKDEIADLTHNMEAFTEIMQMIWERLKGQGENWLIVFKSLQLLEHMLKTGSEKVVQ
jgi:hypothetical protein